jgi:hypothetical protein
MDAHYTISFSGYSMNPFLKPGDRLVVKQVPPGNYRVGDIVVLPNPENIYMVHRLIKLLPGYRGLTKGDSLLASDPGPVTLSSLAGRVEMVVRGRRLIPIGSGPRSILKGWYAVLSRMGLTSGAIRLRIKKAFSGYLQTPGPKKNMSPKQVLIPILRGHFFELSSNINWRRLNEVIYREGLAGIVYQYLKSQKVPAAVLAEMKNYYQNIAAQNIIHLEALNRLEEVLSVEKIEVMTLKGASLLKSVYTSIGLRPMEDLDLMVRPENLACFTKLLQRRGYQQNQKLSNSFKKDHIVIDLHTHALNINRIRSRTTLFPEGMHPIWQSSVPWGTGHRWIRRPNDTDTILLLSQHYLKHYYSRLIWLEDIHRLIGTCDQKFLSDLIDRARQLKQTKSLAYTLYFLQKIYDTPLPVHSTAKALTDDISAIERFLLNPKKEERPSEILAVVMALFCIRGLKNRIWFGLENLFPRSEVMQNEFGGIMGSNRVFFYSLRFFQAFILAIRIISAAVKNSIQRVNNKIF